MEKGTYDCKDVDIVEGIFGEVVLDQFAKVPKANNTTGNAHDDKMDSLTPRVIIKSYTMTNKNGMEAVLISYGATIVSIKCPDKYGESADVILGFDNLENYINQNINPFVGSILGRCANRIEKGYCQIKGNDYQLTINDGQHHLHGGFGGFGKQIWNSQIDECAVVMSYLSADGEEGYPGAVLTTVTFKLTANNKLKINIRATTSKPTIINCSYGSFFNLAGHDAGEEELRKHTVALNCDRWTFAEYSDPIPTGSIRNVGGTVMDLRIPRVLGEYIEKMPPGEGYDYNFCVIRSCQPSVTFVARIFHPPSGRVLEMYSDQPGVQFNTGGRLPMQINETSSSSEILDAKEFDKLASYTSFANPSEENEYDGENDYERLNLWQEKELSSDTTTLKSEEEPLEFILGKNGARYTKFGAFSVQPQNYPNAINIKHFPCSILRPGQVYSHDLIYKFGIQLANSI